MNITGEPWFLDAIGANQATQWQNGHFNPIVSKATGEDNLVMIYAAPIFDQPVVSWCGWVNFASTPGWLKTWPHRTGSDEKIWFEVDVHITTETGLTTFNVDGRSVIRP